MKILIFILLSWNLLACPADDFYIEKIKLIGKYPEGSMVLQGNISKRIPFRMIVDKEGVIALLSIYLHPTYGQDADKKLSDSKVVKKIIEKILAGQPPYKYLDKLSKEKLRYRVESLDGKVSLLMGVARSEGQDVKMISDDKQTAWYYQDGKTYFCTSSVVNALFYTASLNEVTLRGMPKRGQVNEIEKMILAVNTSACILKLQSSLDLLSYFENYFFGQGD